MCLGLCGDILAIGRYIRYERRGVGKDPSVKKEDFENEM
jgi:hypothetical protein